jgi:hypothetical protein
VSTGAKIVAGGKRRAAPASSRSGDAGCARARNALPVDVPTARSIAHYSHAGQWTTGGMSLEEHVERVATAVDPGARAVAYLHDVLEWTDTTTRELEAQGLTPGELAALRLLTRQPSESYELHMLRIAHAGGDAGYVAREVELADLDDHLRESYFVGAPPYAWARRHIMSQYQRERATGQAASA